MFSDVPMYMGKRPESQVLSWLINVLRRRNTAKPLKNKESKRE